MGPTGGKRGYPAITGESQKAFDGEAFAYLKAHFRTRRLGNFVVHQRLADP